MTEPVFTGDAQRALAAAHVASEQDLPRGVKHFVAQRFGTSEVVRIG